jgi:ABC-type uncharacterized transport system permease subunit
MSTQSTHQDRSAARDGGIVSERTLESLAVPVQFVGFWSAVVLPLALFPMLVSGVASEHLVPFTALVAANLLALVVGRDYNSD